MLLDSQCQFDNAHAYTAAALSTNIYDSGPLGSGSVTATSRDLGTGEPLYLSILITTTVTTNVTSVWTLESSAATGITGATTHWTSAAIPVASMVAGYWVCQSLIIPPGVYLRYLALRMTPATNWGAGASSAWLHKSPWSTTTAYKSGYTSSVT